LADQYTVYFGLPDVFQSNIDHGFSCRRTDSETAVLALDARVVVGEIQPPPQVARRPGRGELELFENGNDRNADFEFDGKAACRSHPG
jgi:hypothetical protein